jgi:hypothetical protein
MKPKPIHHHRSTTPSNLIPCNFHETVTLNQNPKFRRPSISVYNPKSIVRFFRIAILNLYSLVSSVQNWQTLNLCFSLLFLQCTRRRRRVTKPMNTTVSSSLLLEISAADVSFSLPLLYRCCLHLRLWLKLFTMWVQSSLMRSEFEEFELKFHSEESILWR